MPMVRFIEIPMHLYHLHRCLHLRDNYCHNTLEIRNWAWNWGGGQWEHSQPGRARTIVSSTVQSIIESKVKVICISCTHVILKFHSFSGVCIHQSFYTYLVENSLVPSHTESYSLQTQRSSRWYLLWAPGRGWWWLVDLGYTRCSYRPGWCRMSLYHSQWYRCILFEEMCIPQLCLLS